MALTEHMFCHSLMGSLISLIMLFFLTNVTRPFLDQCPSILCVWMTFNISVISDVFCYWETGFLDPPVEVVNEEVSAACETATFKPDVLMWKTSQTGPLEIAFSITQAYSEWEKAWC